MVSGLHRRHFLLAGAGAALQGCTSHRPGWPGRGSPPTPSPGLAPLLINEERLIRITVCTRPFRAAGPRLEAETFGEKYVVHNYGHGGSGWSLSWGCAEDALQLARQHTDAPFTNQSYGVIGAGVIGLTTALRLIETGAQVTIYARDFPSESRSARATGVWSPSSRIGLADTVDGNFASRWERWARLSYATHQHYLGTVGHPVEYLQNFSPRSAGRTGQHGESIPASRPFLGLDGRIRDIMPGRHDIPNHAHPFQTERVRGGLMMTFNIAAYTDRLMRDFLLRGGRIVRRSFADHTQILSLSEPVIVNCTGYDAKRLWDDQTLEPVRGQINWLNPQANARYSFFYNQVFVVSRRDGVVVQYTGANDDYGFGDDLEMPDRDEALRTLKTLGPLFG